jgi:hypothetical protein
MTDRVDAAMNWMQPPGADPVVNCVLAEPEGDELAMCHNTMLPTREFGHLPVRCGRFIAYMAIKVHRRRWWHANAGETRRVCVATAPGV